MPNWRRRQILCACSALVVHGAVPALAQDEGVVNALAQVLAAEDARRFDEAVFGDAALHPNPLVRRIAARSMGRIGDPAATPLLLALLTDPDTATAATAAFALGLIGDRTAVPPLRELILSTPGDRQDEVHREAVTAVARIGTEEGGAVIRQLLARWMGRAADDLPRVAVQALWDAWRLGRDAPVGELEAFAASTGGEPGVAALYSLVRLRARSAAPTFLARLQDPDPYARALAARALTRSFADSAGLQPSGVATRLARMVDDSDPGVRITALLTLATYGDPAHAAVVAPKATDPEPNVRVAALEALGHLGGPTALNTIRDHLEGGIAATRRAALLSLARVDRLEALIASAKWITSPDADRRLVGAQALGIVGGDTASAWLEELLHDSVGPVAGAALGALEQADSIRAGQRARGMLLHPDPVVRARAARRVAAQPKAGDVAALAEAYAVALGDSIADARIATVRAMAAVAALDFGTRVAVEDAFLKRFPRPDDYLVRRTAAEVFPNAAERWGPPTPITTGRSIADYRDLARRFLVPDPRQPVPRLIVETERGRIEIELFIGDAPLTLDLLLDLVDRRYFDGGQWHRVVPNFVIQDGDPRGDGRGGPGVVVRDELSRRRYVRGTVGLALSGPDTGGSQFFITVNRQPHLDAAYPALGQVVSGLNLLDRITQGERIRTVRRH